MKTIKYINALIQSILLFASAYASAGSIPLENSKINLNLAPLVEIGIDETNKINIDSILNNNQDFMFQPSQMNTLHFGYQSSTLWIKVKLKNQINLPHHLFLSLEYPLLDSIELYTIKNNKLLNLQLSGDSQPYATKDLKLRQHVFPIRMEPMEAKTFYLAVRSTSSLNIPLFLKDQTTYIEHESLSQSVLGVFYGIVIGFLVYSTGIYFITRKKIYLTNALIIFVYLGFSISYDGYFYLFFPYAFTWQTYSVYFYMILTFACATQFSRRYFQTKYNNEKLDVYLKCHLITTTVLSFTIFLIPITIAPLFAAFMLITSSILLVALGFYYFKSNKQSALFFIIAWGVYVLLLVAATLTALNVLNLQEEMNIIIRLGMIGNILLLSFGIGFNFNHLNKELQLEFTKRKIANKRLELLNQELDNRVKQRTFQLHETNEILTTTLEELKSTQNRLIELNKVAVIGQLVSGVAHEMNTPISVIMTATTFLLKEVEETKVMTNENRIKKSELLKKIDSITQGIQLIESNIYRTNELIRVFKETSIKSYGFTPKKIDLHSSVREILKLFRKRFEEFEIKVYNNIPNQIEITSDPQHLQKIISYLIDNTIQHAFNKEFDERKTIQFRARENVKDIIFEYEDNGIGIPEDNLDKIFNPFYTTKRASGFKGLGLSVIYNMVNHALGGKVEIIPIQKGSLFRITLPKDGPKEKSI